MVRAQLFAADDPHGTLSNLMEHESLARVGIALELGIVLTQALTAVWFYRLFRSVDTFAAGSIAVFGMVNAVAIMGSAALLATALDVARDASLAAAGDAAATVQLLYVASGHLWGVGGMFFGLWLIPMGWLVVRSRWLPQPLGWILIVGGVGYLVSAFVTSPVPRRRPHHRTPDRTRDHRRVLDHGIPDHRRPPPPRPRTRGGVPGALRRLNGALWGVPVARGNAPSDVTDWRVLQRVGGGARDSDRDQPGSARRGPVPDEGTKCPGRRTDAG